MKKTLNVNIGTVSFVIDEDAYYMLRKYLEDVESRFEPGEQEETMNDVEMRIADIFLENLASPRQVVSMGMVKHAISTIGSADEFGERKRNSSESSNTRRLYRSRDEKILGGVCGGIAEYFNIDPTIVRLIAIILAIASLSFGVIVYIILWIVVPQAPELFSDNDKYKTK